MLHPSTSMRNCHCLLPAPAPPPLCCCLSPNDGVFKAVVHPCPRLHRHPPPPPPGTGTEMSTMVCRHPPSPSLLCRRRCVFLREGSRVGGFSAACADDTTRSDLQRGVRWWTTLLDRGIFSIPRGQRLHPRHNGHVRQYR